ncbi:hypothetical protein ACFX15_033935 [Malus domestica]
MLKFGVCISDFSLLLKRHIKLIIEMDSSSAVLLLNQSVPDSFHSLATLLKSCRDLMRRIDHCELKHIFREVNSVVDQLAKWSYNLYLGWHSFEFPPQWLMQHIMDDHVGALMGRSTVLNAMY